MKKLIIFLSLLGIININAQITLISVGTEVDDANSDPIRTAFIKCNENFQNLYTNLQAFTNQLNITSNSLVLLSNQVAGFDQTFTNMLTNAINAVNNLSNQLNTASNAIIAYGNSNLLVYSNSVAAKINTISNDLTTVSNQVAVMNTTLSNITTLNAAFSNGLPVNVKWVGATGNGVTDDTIAINTAISLTGTTNSIYFPKGIYGVTSSLLFNAKTNMSIIGDSATIKNINANWANTTPMLCLSNVNGIILKDLALSGNSNVLSYTSGGFKFHNFDNCVFENLSVSNCGYRSIYALLGNNSTFKHINVIVPIDIGAVSSCYMQMLNFIIDDFKVNGNAQNSTTLNLANNITLIFCSSGKINNLYSIDGSVNELYLLGCNDIIINDMYARRATNGIALSPSVYVTNGNNITFNSPTINGYVYDSPANNHNYGLAIVGGNNYQINNCNLTNSWVGLWLIDLTNAVVRNGNISRNASLGLQLSTCRDVKLSDIKFNYNGWNYGTGFTNFTQPYTAHNIGFAVAVRHNSSYITFNNCEATYSGRDGFNVNQGSHDIKFYNCIANNNWDGGFTLMNDTTDTNRLGDAQCPYNISYYNCEAENNFGAGLASYSASYNVNIHGGQYYNNKFCAGVTWTNGGTVNTAEQNSTKANIFFAAGSKNITLKGPKIYDNRQFTNISAFGFVDAGEAVRCVFANNQWDHSLNEKYPKVALLSVSNTFYGYGLIDLTRSSGTNLYIIKTATNTFNTAVMVNDLKTVTQRLTSFGVWFDTAVSAIVDYDELYGFVNTTSDAQGIFSNYGADYQNVKLLSGTLITPNIIKDPDFLTDTNLTSWSAAYVGTFSVDVTTNTFNAPAHWAARGVMTNGEYFTLDANLNLPYENLSGMFVTFGAWVYCDLPRGILGTYGAYIQSTWSSNGAASSKWHPGDSRWHWLEVNGLMDTRTAYLYGANPFRIRFETPTPDTTEYHCYVAGVRAIVKRADYEGSMFDTYNSLYPDTVHYWQNNP